MACWCLFRLLKWVVFGAIVVLLIRYWLSTKQFIFSEDAVAAVARKHVGPDVEASFNKMHREFTRLYPNHILPKEDLQWLFLNAGGSMGSMCILHASLTEYLFFFGTALETSGHSGRYWANISETVLTGTLSQWQEGALQVKVYKAGDTVQHPMGEVMGVNLAADTWTVQYGRGFIPSPMSFAMADTLFSTQDFLTMFYTMRIYVKSLALEASHSIFQFKDFLEKQFS